MIDLMVKKKSGTYVLGEYEQKERSFHTISQGLPSNDATRLVAASSGMWAGTDAGLARLAGDVWVKAADEGGPPAGIVRALLESSRGEIWAAVEDCLYMCANGRWQQSPLTGPILALGEDEQGRLWAADEHALVCDADGHWTMSHRLELQARVRDIVVLGNEVYLATDAGLHYLTGRRAHFFEVQAKSDELVSNDIRCLYADRSGHLWLGTDKGVCLYDNRHTWYTWNGTKGMPYEDVHCMAVAADGTRWFGTSSGLVVMKDGKWKYYAYGRWLPGDHVRSVAIDGSGAVWAATDQGIACISSKFMRLEEKAAHYLDLVRKYHVRDGYVTVRELDEAGNMESGRVEKSDNDGYWTAVYTAAEVFRHAVTGAEDARRNARESMEAILRLTSVTGWPGFPARGVRRSADPEFGEKVAEPLGWVQRDEGEYEWKGQAGTKETDWHEWRRTTDGEWEWKGDTSSDEIVGHFYIYAIYYDLMADEGEKRAISATAAAIADHIIDHGFRLVDIDGEPTTWANWSPGKLNGDSKWAMQRGINSLELLALLKASAHMTGDTKYEDVYRELVSEQHYAMNMLEQKIEFLGRVSHIDDELGFHAYYTLLSYERDPDLRALYMASLEHHWQYERRERSPLWNFVYGALTDAVCDVEAAVQSLAEMPLDLIHWPVKNSHRSDAVFDAELEPYGYKQLAEPLPFDERPMHKWDANPFKPDGGDGFRAEDGTVFLHPYWLGRYWKLIDEG